MSGKEKRERKPNYTPEEKIYLTELIAQVKDIIDDKRTTGIFIKKKNEAWKAITTKYNSRCTTGPREIDNLKALYDNMKQKARRSGGECNVQINKTNGAFYTPKPTDSDMKMLSIVKVEIEQVEPLSNPFDSAADYFKDNINMKHTHQSPIKLELDSTLSTAPDMETTNHPPEENSWHHHQQPSSIASSPGTEAIKTVAYQKCLPNKKSRRKKVPMVPKKHIPAETLKRLYFKKKCHNAYLEGKKIMQDILYAKQKHNLEMSILRKRLENQ